MKKLVFGCFLAANIFMLTSCLGDGKNERSYAVLGVMDTDYTTLRTLFYYSEYAYPAYISNFATTTQRGDCFYANLTINGDDNPDPATAGYEIAILNNYEAISSFAGRTSLSDTSIVYDAEMAMVNLEVVNYVKDHLFLVSTHEDMGEKQENVYELSFDYSQKPVKDSNGKNVYSLFYRVTKEKEGQSPFTTKASINAFRLNNFFDNIQKLEKDAGEKYYHFKINYIKSFDKDSVPTWASTETYSTLIIDTSES